MIRRSFSLHFHYILCILRRLPSAIASLLIAFPQGISRPFSPGRFNYINQSTGEHPQHPSGFLPTPQLLVRQPSRYCMPLQLSRVLKQSAMERHKMPFIHPLLSTCLLEVFIFLSQSHYGHYSKLISYMDRALSAGWRRQEAAAHFSRDGFVWR